jgi:hypothetical protein
MVDLACRLGDVWRDSVDMGLQCGQEIGVQGCDQIVVVFLLIPGLEGIPGEVIYVPGVLQLNVWKAESNGAVGFGEKRD